MARLFVAEFFDEQLERYLDDHANDMGLIDALLEELMSDEALLDSLLCEVPKWHWTYKPSFEFKRFEEASRDAMEVYFLKIYDESSHLIDFRVFVGYDLERNDFYVLCMGLRDDCFDPHSETYRAIRSVYDQLGLPRGLGR